jgi:hypothetical protein
MSQPKEPYFFDTDHIGPRRQLSRYESLFCGADDSHTAVGEATPSYLYSKAAVPNILQYNSDALFIVCLRNPVDMAYSLHDENLFQGAQNTEDFATAWQMGQRRLAAGGVTRWRREQLAYGKVCLLGEQVQRLLTKVPEGRAHFVFLEDLAVRPRDEYVKAVRFLGADDDGRGVFPVLNSAKRLKWPFLSRCLKIATNIRRTLGPARPMPRVKATVGQVFTFLHTWNRVERAREAMPLSLRRHLQEYFSDDVMLLGKIVGRDLSGWVKDSS